MGFVDLKLSRLDYRQSNGSRPAGGSHEGRKTLKRFPSLLTSRIFKPGPRRRTSDIQRCVFSYLAENQAPCDRSSHQSFFLLVGNVMSVVGSVSLSELFLAGSVGGRLARKMRLFLPS